MTPDPSRWAGSSIRAVLFDFTFWRLHLQLVICWVVCIVGLVWGMPLVTRGGAGTVLLTGSITVLGLRGLIIGSRAVARLAIERAIADVVERKAVAWLRDIHNRPGVRPTLDDVEQRLLPANPIQEIGVLRIFQHILKEARDRKSSPAYAMTQPTRDEAMGDLFRIQTLQRTSLQLGILGTFVGLVLALVRLRPAAGEGLAVQDLGALIGSLDMAFTTSIAGIAVAVFLGLVMTTLRRSQEQYFRAVEEASLSVSSLGRQAINQDEYLAELGQVQVAIHQLGDRILDQAHQTEAQTQVIQDGLQGLVDSKRGLDSFLAGLAVERSAFLEEMKKIYKLLSPEHLVEQIDGHVRSSMDGMLEQWRLNLDSMTGQFASLDEPISRVSTALDRLDEGFEEERKRHRESYEVALDSTEELASSIDRLAGRQVDWLEELDSRIPRKLEERWSDAIQEVMSALARRIEDLIDTQADARSAVPTSRMDELLGTIRTAGEIQQTTLRRLIDETQKLRQEVQESRRSRSWWRKLGFGSRRSTLGGQP